MSLVELLHDLKSHWPGLFHWYSNFKEYLLSCLCGIISLSFSERKCSKAATLHLIYSKTRVAKSPVHLVQRFTELFLAQEVSPWENLEPAYLRIKDNTGLIKCKMQCRLRKQYIISFAGKFFNPDQIQKLSGGLFPKVWNGLRWKHPGWQMS